MTEAELALQVRADRVDILVELTGEEPMDGEYVEMDMFISGG